MPSSISVEYTPLSEAATLQPSLSHKSSNKGSMVKITKPIEDRLVQDPEVQVGDNSSKDGSPQIVGATGGSPIVEEKAEEERENSPSNSTADLDIGKQG